MKGEVCGKYWTVLDSPPTYSLSYWKSTPHNVMTNHRQWKRHRQRQWQWQWKRQDSSRQSANVFSLLLKIHSPWCDDQPQIMKKDININKDKDNDNDKDKVGPESGQLANVISLSYWKYTQRQRQRRFLTAHSCIILSLLLKIHSSWWSTWCWWYPLMERGWFLLWYIIHYKRSFISTSQSNLIYVFVYPFCVLDPNS